MSTVAFKNALSIDRILVHNKAEAKNALNTC